MIKSIKDYILYLFYNRKIKYTKNVLKTEYKSLIKKYEKEKIISKHSILMLNYILYYSLSIYNLSTNYKYKLTNRIILIITKTKNKLTLDEFNKLTEIKEDEFLICKNIILKEKGYYRSLWTQMIKSKQ